MVYFLSTRAETQTCVLAVSDTQLCCTAVCPLG
ncbi:hypothetical protein F383_34720 [Gossypium arboreum]|uniref:Uncharacterized protein n=1 Tax=Gossypium arboreum TaxID=29729 RepID=A0A0B0MZD4_GOSAR|nr:hypothetical protein F383_34720 [Gossypium arboreum]